LYGNLQTRLLVREGATKLQVRNFLKEISRRKKNCSQVPDRRLTQGQTGRLTVRRKLTATATMKKEFPFREPRHSKKNGVWRTSGKLSPATFGVVAEELTCFCEVIEAITCM
jgi:hypothetical protein